MNTFFNFMLKLFKQKTVLTKEDLLTELRRLHKMASTDVKKIPCNQVGICCNIADLMQKKQKLKNFYQHTSISILCRHLFIGWPSHSGRDCWPIPVVGSPFDEYDKWEGEALEHRISLLSYTIKKLKNMSADEFNSIKQECGIR